MFYRRRLPHLYVGEQPVFLTWSLDESIPPNRSFPKDAYSGKVFYLRQPEIAGMIVEVMHYSANVLKHYNLHAFVVMPNHVHMLLSPHVPVPKLTKSLKGFTAKRANQILGRTGLRFWREESYDHLVRDQSQFERIRRYIEQNPVRAGLVREAGEYPWSSAFASK